MTKPQKNNNAREDKQYKEELIDLSRVTRVVKWGRRMRFRASVVVWDENWKVWLWVWKANEVTTAIQKAISQAKKSFITFPIVNWTISKDVLCKFKAAKILIMPAFEGTWIIAWWSVRKIAEVAWIHNLLSKRFWSWNKLTNAQCMIKALEALSKQKVRVKKENNEWAKSEAKKTTKKD